MFNDVDSSVLALLHPVNDSLFYNDLALETEDIEADHKLSHPGGNYYKRKETTE